MKQQPCVQVEDVGRTGKGPEGRVRRGGDQALVTADRHVQAESVVRCTHGVEELRDLLPGVPVEGRPPRHAPVVVLCGSPDDVITAHCYGAPEGVTFLSIVRVDLEVLVGLSACGRGHGCEQC